MIAKVIAHAPSRGEAAGRLADALTRSRLHGVTTNRDLLVRILREPEFLAGDTDTGYLERHNPAELGAPLVTPPEHIPHLIAATLALQIVNRRRASVCAELPSGWRNNPAIPQRLALRAGEIERTVEYSIGRSGEITMTIDSESVNVVLHSAAYHDIDATVEGVRRRYRVAIPADDSFIDVDSPLGSTSYTVVPRFADPSDQVEAGSLVAQMPGSVVRVLVEVGASVAKSDPLLVVEAMKMEHTVTSPTDGIVIELRVDAGTQVNTGSVLAVVEPTLRGVLIH